MARRNVIIMGSAGRDFHNFNVFFRNNKRYNVVGFTGSQQIPGISGKTYPPELSGELYPEGIPIYAEEELSRLIKELHVDDCVFAYSDVSYQHVMHIGAIVNAAGATYMMLGPKDTMLRTSRPVIAVCAVRTGSGKSQTSRRIIELLKKKGVKVIAVRHPMPYGELSKQKVQRLAQLGDLKKHNCTIEEIEEYEPHLVQGTIVYAGADYLAILKAAEKDPEGCDVIVWDGGNNDFPFFRPDLMIVVADPHRAGHEVSYYPGEVNLRMADVALINKVDSAAPENVQKVRESIATVNPDATLIEAASVIHIDNPSLIRGKRVLVIEDGPTVTHGGMAYGAGTIAARQGGAVEIVDPRPYAVESIAEAFRHYPGIGPVLPAIGYSTRQLQHLEATINRVNCDVVMVATPIDLSRIIDIRKPHTRVSYELQEVGKPDLEDILSEFARTHNLPRGSKNDMSQGATCTYRGARPGKKRQ
ncbi:MAG TPA: cyclic 2,3-diphosphoglycerate synthase [Dehalococcoidia bacterium]|nr:cyclic 2,3-diphosphoglycerate synthase [Dehalococcoidia bacterium]